MWRVVLQKFGAKRTHYQVPGMNSSRKPDFQFITIIVIAGVLYYCVYDIQRGRGLFFVRRWSAEDFEL